LKDFAAKEAMKRLRRRRFERQKSMTSSNSKEEGGEEGAVRVGCTCGNVTGVVPHDSKLRGHVGRIVGKEKKRTVSTKYGWEKKT